MASPNAMTAFNARSSPQLMASDQLFRVYFAPGGLFFIRIGGSRPDQLAIHFGLVGYLALKLMEGSRQRKVEEKMADMDQRSLHDRLEDHKANFSELYSAIDSSEIRVPGIFQSSSAGKDYGKWRVDFASRKAMDFFFNTVDDMDIAVTELPKVLGEKHTNFVEWNERKQKYVKAKRPASSDGS